MGERSQSAGSEEAFAAAARRYPQADFAIRMLMKRSESFRDMCEELADAERAILQTVGTQDGSRDERRIEWQELIDRLVMEVGAALWQSRARRDGEG